MLGEFITRVLVLVLGYGFPAIECFKTVEKNKVSIEELRFWCQYWYQKGLNFTFFLAFFEFLAIVNFSHSCATFWIVVAILTVFESIGDTLFSWLPVYDELKLTLLIYLWYPKTKGTSYVYDTLLRPYMAGHETEWNRKIQEFRVRAWDFALYYWQNCTELGQTKWVEMLQFISGQPARLKQGKLATMEDQLFVFDEEPPTRRKIFGLKSRSGRK